jgi:Na+/H+ antiporter NhaA
LADSAEVPRLAADVVLISGDMSLLQLIWINDGKVALFLFLFGLEPRKQ